VKPVYIKVERGEGYDDVCDELVLEDFRQNPKAWNVSLCTPDDIAAEREACAKIAEQGVDIPHPTVKNHIMRNFGKSTEIAAAIRERGKT